MKTLFELKDYNANGGGQAIWPPVSRNYQRTYHTAPAVPDPLLPSLELTEQFRDWIVAHDEQYIIEDVTPAMMDWFWANIEKCFVLWAPGDHNWMSWLKAPAQVGFVGSQTIGTSLMIPGGPMGGVRNTRMDMDQYPFTTCLDHCVIEYSEVGDEVRDGKCDSLGIDAYYVSSWSAHDKGILWRNTTIVKPGGLAITDLWDETKHPEAAEGQPLPPVSGGMPMPPMPGMPPKGDVPAQDLSGNPQSAHGIYEIARFSQFLPDLYRIWKVVDDPGANVPNDLRVAQREDGSWYYVSPLKPLDFDHNKEK